jgi:hypothetical protein
VLLFTDVGLKSIDIRCRPKEQMEGFLIQQEKFPASRNGGFKQTNLFFQTLVFTQIST